MKALRLVLVLAAIGALGACATSYQPGALRPAAGTAEKLFAENRFASVHMVRNMSTESNTIVLDLEGGPPFVPLSREFFKEVKEDAQELVRRELAVEGKIFAMMDGQQVLGYLVKTDKDVPFGRQARYYVFMDRAAGTYTVRSQEWDSSDGEGSGIGR